MRDDIDNIEIENMKTKKKIIITTNLRVRGAQISTDYETERNGGLHIIITEIPNNSRNTNQAFGRVYSGKRGSGQFIYAPTEKEKFKTHEDLMKERNIKEKEKIDKININDLLFKEELIQEYSEFLKKFPELKNDKNIKIKYEINERWALFLTKNFNHNINRREIMKNFFDFKSEIDIIMGHPEYTKLNNNNNFLKNVNIFNFINKENISFEDIYNSINFEGCNECFYFSISYIKSLIEIAKFIDSPLNKNKNYVDCKINCKKIIEYLEQSKKQIREFIERIIQCEEYNIRFFSSEMFIYKQFELRKKILIKLIKNVEVNINTVNKFIDSDLYKNCTLNVVFYKVNKEIKEYLKLDYVELENLDFLSDMGIDFLYEIKVIGKKLENKAKSFLIENLINKNIGNKSYIESIKINKFSFIDDIQ